MLAGVGEGLDLASAEPDHRKRARVEKPLFGHPGGPHWRKEANEGDFTHYARWHSCKRHGWCSERQWRAEWTLHNYESACRIIFTPLAKVPDYALAKYWTCRRGGGWDYEADNPTSTAVGYNQCLTSMHPECEGDGPLEQVRWTHHYYEVGPDMVEGTTDDYDSPMAAWRHWNAQVPINGVDHGHWY
jgi:hypothetical protein